MVKCDCCRVIIGYSKYTVINEHDTLLYICEDCLKKEITDVNKRTEF